VKLHQKTTTKDLALEIAKASGIKLHDVRHVLECLPLCILKHNILGKTVQMLNLGRFRPVPRKARIGSDLKNRRIHWPPTIRMVFTPSRLVREKLQEAANK
jgi:nucleoid DNA-binding protein